MEDEVNAFTCYSFVNILRCIYDVNLFLKPWNKHNPILLQRILATLWSSDDKNYLNSQPRHQKPVLQDPARDVWRKLRLKQRGGIKSDIVFLQPASAVQANLHESLLAKLNPPAKVPTHMFSSSEAPSQVYALFGFRWRVNTAYQWIILKINKEIEVLVNLPTTM